MNHHLCYQPFMLSSFDSTNIRTDLGDKIYLKPLLALFSVLGPSASSDPIAYPSISFDRFLY